MRKSLYIVFSSTILASAFIYGDYFQDFSQSSGTSFTDQNHGYNAQQHNNSNWQNPNNNWTENQFKRANPNENNWTADANQSQNIPQQNQSQNSSQNPYQNNSQQNAWRSNSDNSLKLDSQSQSHSPNVTKRAINNKYQNTQKGAVGFNDSQTPQRSYDSRPAPSNWENSESSNNSVWNTYYDNQNPPQQPKQPPRIQRPPTNSQQPQQNTYQGAQWISYDDSTQTQKYFDKSSNATDSFSDTSTSPNSSASATSINSKDQASKNSDLKVTRAIQLALTRDKALSTLAQHVIVMTNNGQVYLRGNVNSDAEKDKVEAIARKVDGVNSVDNQLTVLNISSQ